MVDIGTLSLILLLSMFIAYQCLIWITATRVVPEASG